jgi:outer membrane lipoprotein carrier protein
MIRSRPFSALSLRFGLTALLLIAVVGVLHAQGGTSAIERATALYKGAKTARGSIEKTTTNALTGRTYVTRGDYQQQFPHKVSINFSEPRGDAIVSDGAFVWLYTPSSTPGVVLKVPIVEAATWINLINVLFDSTRTRFSITEGARETLGGATVQLVTLVPRSAMRDLQRARVWIDVNSGHVRQFEVVENPDITHRILFTTLDLNAAVDTSRFTFVVPRNVRVETPRG